MNISKAKIEDIDELNILLVSLFSQEFEFTPNLENQTIALNKIISNESIGVVFKATFERKIVGMVSLLFSESTALGGRVAMLEDMVIDTSVRGQGVGKRLIDYALKEAKNLSCKRITLLTDENNHIAHNFYVKNGFKKSTMIPFRLML
jgi:GNAT superfamily N-acetyltransferase